MLVIKFVFEFLDFFFVVGDECFEFEGVPLFKGVLFEVEEVYYLLAVFFYESSGVADVVPFVEAVASATLGVAVLFVVAGGHVAAVDVMAAVHFVEVVYTAA